MVGESVQQRAVFTILKASLYNLGSIESLTRKAEEELDRLSKTMGFMEKGKIRVKGLLEAEPDSVPMPAVVAAPEEQAPQEAEA